MDGDRRLEASRRFRKLNWSTRGPASRGGGTALACTWQLHCCLLSLHDRILHSDFLTTLHIKATTETSAAQHKYATYIREKRAKSYVVTVSFVVTRAG